MRHHVFAAWVGACCVAACLMLSIGNARAAGVPDFAIVSPAAGAVVHDPVTLVVKVDGAEIGKPIDGLDHLHVSIDGGPVMAVYKNQPMKFNLSDGRHTIAVELAGPTHRPLLPPKSVDFSVK